MHAQMGYAALKYALMITSVFLSLFLFLALIGVYAQQSFSLCVYYYPDCFGCMEKMDNVVLPFYESNKDSIQLVLRSLNNQTNQQQFYEDFEGDLAYILVNKVDSPYVMFRNDNKTLRIYGENLTRTNLEKALDTFSTSNQTGTGLSAVTPRLDVDIAALVFSAGVFSGINPCLIAFTTYMTSASIQTRSNKSRSSILRILARVATISAGVVAWYFLVGIVFHGIHPVETAVLKLVLVTTFAALGIAYIISSRNTSSRLFQTPRFLKNAIATRSKKSSIVFDFLLGVGFALIKTPCLVGPYLVILSWLTTNTTVATLYILIFNLGVVVPLFAIAGFLASGIVNLSTIDRFRTKERNITRLLTGVLLVSTAILLLVF